MPELSVKGQESWGRRWGRHSREQEWGTARRVGTQRELLEQGESEDAGAMSLERQESPSLQEAESAGLLTPVLTTCVYCSHSHLTLILGALRPRALSFSHSQSLLPSLTQVTIHDGKPGRWKGVSSPDGRGWPLQHCPVALGRGAEPCTPRADWPEF